MRPTSHDQQVAIADPYEKMMALTNHGSTNYNNKKERERTRTDKTINLVTTTVWQNLRQPWHVL